MLAFGRLHLLFHVAWLLDKTDSRRASTSSHLHKHVRPTTTEIRTVTPEMTHADDHNRDMNGGESQQNLSQQIYSYRHGIAAEESDFFIERLFGKYGNDSLMTYQNFEKFITNIGLGSIKEDENKHLHDHDAAHGHDDVQLATDSAGSLNSPGHDDHNHSDHNHKRRSVISHRHVHDITKRKVPTDVHYHSYHNECLTPVQLLEAFDFDPSGHVTKLQFIHLCPALIYQLDNRACSDSKDHHDNHSDIHSAGTVLLAIHSVSAKVWGFSTVAVVIISLVGLLGVAVIPIMQKVFYNHLLQFLVALAVGALSGDALLHLLPHALQGPHDHTKQPHIHTDASGGNEGHSLDGVHKGLCALLGIYFFFLMERILTIITDLKRKRKKKKQRKGPNQGSFTRTDHGDCEETVMVIHPNKALKTFAEDSHDECVSLNTTSNSLRADPTEADDEDTIGGHSHHGHGHSHAHGHKVPTSVAAIAWMVILGDGIHNFSDGLAIGAAFANSITGGISTSIAVFCHELPHEIGDFAVLLRAGMSAKQAIIYNCVSSVLCFIGMLIGVAIGNISSASLWVFAGVGGIFLYIALVDMLPEMTSVDTKEGEHPFKHLLFQCVGMLLGAGIMLLIAIYEDDLKNSLG